MIYIYICIYYIYIYIDIRIYDYVSRLLRTAITKWINSTCPGIFFATGSLDEPRVVSSIHFLWLSIEVGEEKSMFSGSINYIYNWSGVKHFFMFHNIWDNPSH